MATCSRCGANLNRDGDCVACAFDHNTVPCGKCGVPVYYPPNRTPPAGVTIVCPKCLGRPIEAGNIGYETSDVTIDLALASSMAATIAAAGEGIATLLSLTADGVEAQLASLDDYSEEAAARRTGYEHGIRTMRAISHDLSDRVLDLERMLDRGRDTPPAGEGHKGTDSAEQN